MEERSEEDGGGFKDRAKKIAMLIGMFVSSTIFILGFPCATYYPAAAFRATCAGYFTCNLLGYVIGDSPYQKQILRCGLLINSIASFIISAYWCLRFFEWVIILVLEHVFTICGTILFCGDGATRHFLFTFIGSVLCYILFGVGGWGETIDASEGKLWTTCVAALVVTLIAGMCAVGYLYFATLRRKVEMILEIIRAEDLSQSSLGSRESPSSSPEMGKMGIFNSPLSSGKGVGATDSGRTSSTLNSSSPKKTPFEGLELIKLVGSGSFGQVHLGMWRGEKVAVKIVKWMTSASKSNPEVEARLASRLRHPNLVKTFSFQDACIYVSEDEPSLARQEDDEMSVHNFWMILEWCDRGVLWRHAQSPRYIGPDLQETLLIMLDITRAGEYLHSHGVIHGDLTACNVLLKSQSNGTRDYICKVCDFGLSRVVEENASALMTSNMGTVSYMPPELFTIDRKGPFSRAVDVYATGVLLWQVLLGKMPHAGMTAPQIVISVSRGKRLDLPEDVRPDIRDIFINCTSTNPRDRPTYSELVKLFSDALVVEE